MITVSKLVFNNTKPLHNKSGVQVAKVKGIADGLERVSVHAGHNGTNALGSYGMPQRLMRTRR